jgi:hypothetical protein
LSNAVVESELITHASPAKPSKKRDASSGPEVIKRCKIDVDEEEMREEALNKITHVLGKRPSRVGKHGAQIYQCPKSPQFYIRTNKPQELQNGDRKYWFGLDTKWFNDLQGFFIFQCGMDFTLVVPIADWVPIKDDLGHASMGAKRQPHIHLENNNVEIRERMRTISPFVKNVFPWVEAWELLREEFEADSL